MKIAMTEQQLAFFKEQGARGGKTAAANMTEKRRKTRAKKAAKARWAKAKKAAPDA
jgi:hypothetical protein